MSIYSKSMRLHVHNFAQLAPEPTQPVTLWINVTRVLYVDDYNYQYTKAVIFLSILTPPITYRIICAIYYYLISTYKNILKCLRLPWGS